MPFCHLRVAESRIAILLFKDGPKVALPFCYLRVAKSRTAILPPTGGQKSHCHFATWLAKSRTSFSVAIFREKKKSCRYLLLYIIYRLLKGQLASPFVPPPLLTRPHLAARDGAQGGGSGTSASCYRPGAVRCRTRGGLGEIKRLADWGVGAERFSSPCILYKYAIVSRTHNVNKLRCMASKVGHQRDAEIVFSNFYD